MSCRLILEGTLLLDIGREEIGVCVLELRSLFNMRDMIPPLFLRKIWAFRATLSVILPPLILLPIPIVIPTTEAACGYTILLMAVYWIAEVIPLAVTSFLPLIIFPMSGIMTGAEVSSSFFRDSSWLFVGGLLIAIAVEDTGLHKRTALRILMIVGAKPRSLMFGFMSITFFLSMWISTTATTAMMLPIVEAVFNELKAESERNFEKARSEFCRKSEVNSIGKSLPGSYTQTTSFYDNETFEMEVKDPSLDESDFTESTADVESSASLDAFEEYEQAERNRMELLIKGVTLCVPFASSIGGTATVTGTAPNLVLAGHYAEAFPDADMQLTFGNWIIYALPGAVVTLVLAYMWLCWYFFGFGSWKEAVMFWRKSRSTAGEKAAMQVIRKEYENLGTIRWGEVSVLVVFIVTTLLWFFREPGFMPGWAIIFPDGYVTDGTVAVTMSFLLFILPSRKPSLIDKKDTSEIKKPVPSILDWKTVHKMFPWDILFLFAGGYALADGSTKSGFSAWMGDLLAFDDSVDDWVICLVCTTIVCLFTQVSNNTATSSIFAPILAQLACVINGVHVARSNAVERDRILVRTPESHRSDKDWLVAQHSRNRSNNSLHQHLWCCFLRIRRFSRLGTNHLITFNNSAAMFQLYVIIDVSYDTMHFRSCFEVFPVLFFCVATN